MAYFTTKEFDKSLKASFMGGGQRQKEKPSRQKRSLEASATMIFRNRTSHEPRRKLASALRQEY